MLSKISQLQKDKYCMIPLTYGISKRQTHRTRDQNGGCQGLGGGAGNGEMLVKGRML